MARTASMTAEGAERLLGPRGQLTVTKENRALVRKWLVAKGIASTRVSGVSYQEMRDAYNSVGDTGLDALRGPVDWSGYVAIDGHTWPVRHELARMGGRWDGESRVWRVPAARAAEARALVGGVDSRVPAEPVAPIVAPVAAPVTNGHGASTGAGAALVAAIAAIAGKALDQGAVESLIQARLYAFRPGLDVDAVRELIRSEIPVTRLEIVRGGVAFDLGAAPRHAMLERALRYLGQGINVALIGPAGSGKTTAAEQMAAALGVKFYINGAMSGAHEIFGIPDMVHGGYTRTAFREAYEHGGLWLADELDGCTDPAVPLALNAALANGYCQFPDSPLPIKRHPDFYCVAAANTYWSGPDRVYVGRCQLDGATFDRFAMVDWGYDEKLEMMLAGNDAWCARVQALRHAAARIKAQVIISPRASINGAKALAAGAPQDEVEQDFIWKGTAEDVKRRVMAAII